jgi:hypothetical protein
MKDNIIAYTEQYFDGLLSHKEYLYALILAMTKEWDSMEHDTRKPDVIWLSDVIHSYSEDREDD